MIDDKTIFKRTFALYSKYGIKSVSVDDVAMMLGISKKTLYEHITSREMLIRNSLDNNLKDFLEKLKQYVEYDDDPITKLCRFYAFIIKNVRKINPSFSHDLKKYYPVQYQIIVKLRDDILFKYVCEILNKGITEGIFREDLNLKYVYYNQTNKISALGNLLSEDQHTIPPQTLYILIINDIRGISTLKGHQKLERMYNTILKIL